MQYKWSALNNAFFPVPLLYIYVGWDLSDLIDIDPAVVEEFGGPAPFGKMRVVGEDGMPAWADLPEDDADPSA